LRPDVDSFQNFELQSTNNSSLSLKKWALRAFFCVYEEMKSRQILAIETTILPPESGCFSVANTYRNSPMVAYFTFLRAFSFHLYVPEIPL
jgi:hypothetical protein